MQKQNQPARKQWDLYEDASSIETERYESGCTQSFIRTRISIEQQKSRMRNLSAV